MSTYKIETDVPMPASRHSGHSYPFADMKVGDSFVVPNDAGHRRVSLATKARAWSVKHNPDASFSTRITDDNLHIRIWRIK